MKNIYEIRSANKLKSAIIVVFFFVFVLISVYFISKALGIYVGYEPSSLGFLGIGLIVSGISTFVSYYYSDKIVLKISGARIANSQEDKLFTSVVENISIGAGLKKPKLYVIEDSAPNAFATGRNPEHSIICVTTGLLDKLTRTELEGVLAHELTHIKNFDMRLMSVVSVMVGLIALLGDWFLRISFRGRSRNNNEKNQLGVIILILGILFAIASPIIAKLIQLAISRRREFMADAGSVEITRQPQGLISALKKISSDTEVLEAANKATAHLYIVSPFKSSVIDHKRTINKLASLFNTHPPILERIETLQKMA